MGPVNVLAIGTVVLAALIPAFVPGLFTPSTPQVTTAAMPTPVVVEQTAANPPALVQAPVGGSAILPVPNTDWTQVTVQTVVLPPSNPPAPTATAVPAPITIEPAIPAPIVVPANVSPTAVPTKTTPPPKVVPETPAALRPVVLAAAAKHGVPSEILSAALARESANFKDKYVYGWHVDGTGRGIAGIDKKYHPEVSDKDAFDPVYSIDWMANYLSGLIKKNRGDVYSALREYNGGPNFASMRAGYQGRPVAELTKAHADAIYAHAAKAVTVR